MEKESLQLSSCQQWKVAFIHAFASTFNPQQTIAPSFFKLPEFTPNVTIEMKLSFVFLIHIYPIIAIRSRDSKRRQRTCT